MNPYLLRRREQFEAIRTTIEGLQTRAAGEDRDLTPDELRSVTEQGEQARTIAAEIESLTDIETRSARVAELATQIAGGDGPATGAAQTRSTSTTTTSTRDPGHYRSAKEGGERSFFGDIYRSRVFGDEHAARRLTEHNRALDTTGEGVGTVAPKWMTDEFQLLARQGRALANVVRNIPLGDDPRPMTMPKQTAGTDAVVAEQANENDPVPGTDAWDSDVDVVTPKPTTGKQTVSRQMVDMSSPAIDQLIYGDLMAVYNSKVEAKVGAALVVAAGAAVTTFATEAAFTGTAPAMPATDSVVDLALAVRSGRKLPADVLAMTVRRWGRFKKLKDTTGRPVIPSGSGGTTNVFGVGNINYDGIIEDLPAIMSDGLGTTAYPESYLAFRAADQILFESNLLRFRFEEQAGPESIVLGIWGYTAFISRQAGLSVKRVIVTAAA